MSGAEPDSMIEPTARWLDRFASLKNSVSQLSNISSLLQLDEVPSELLRVVRFGSVKYFESSFDLSWKTIKDYLEPLGLITKNPRDAIKAGWSNGLIVDVDGWLKALRIRMQLSDVCDEDEITTAVAQIRSNCLPLLESLVKELTRRAQGVNDGLSDSYREKLFGVLEQYPQIARVFVFGSRSTGRYRKDSDLDLAFETVTGEPLDAKVLTKIKYAIDDLYLAIDIDLIDRAAITNAKFAAAIARDGKLWWERGSHQRLVG